MGSFPESLIDPSVRLIGDGVTRRVAARSLD